MGMLMVGAFLGGLLSVAAALLVPGRPPETPFSQPLPPPMKLGRQPAPGPAARPAPAAAPGTPGESLLAVVVDGLGYDPSADAESLKLPEKVTLAVIPFGPSSRRIAQAARSRGFTVLVHVPMEPEGQASDRTERFRLRRSMPRDEMEALLARMVRDVPHAAGASNYMGSALTADPEAMATFAALLRARGLYLVDSVTTPRSKALEAARIAGIPAARRDVSLDAGLSPAEMRGRWDRAVSIARARGAAVLVCRGEPGAVRFVAGLLPGLRSVGVRAVTMDELLAAREH